MNNESIQIPTFSDETDIHFNDPNNSAYVEPQTFIPPYPSAIPNHYNSEVMIYRGFWMVSWFKKQFGQKTYRR